MKGAAREISGSYRSLRHRPRAGAGWGVYSLKRRLHGPHPPPREIVSRSGKGEGPSAAAQHGATGGTRPHPSLVSATMQTADALAAAGGPPKPLRRHWLKYQVDDGSFPSMSVYHSPPQ